MFTGIVEGAIPILSSEATAAGRRISISSNWPEVRLGESIAINGVCLTVAALSERQIAFDIIPETLSKTTLGDLRQGEGVHVERALRVGDRLDGHIVQGHVDGRARVVAVKADPADWRITLEPPADLAQYIIPKGSVTLDGVSLTIADVAGLRFQVALIPTTLSITTLGERKAGDFVNIECDAMTKTIVATMQRLEALRRE